MAQSIKLAIINPKGKNEIIEFFDYNCIHCKRVAKVIDNFLKTRNDIRVVLRPIPILGQSSLYTTQIGYAILLLDTDKYLDFYNMVMDSSDGIGELIYDITDKININIEGLKTILRNNNDDIKQSIEDNIDLADKFGIQGTPSFIVNGKVIQGEIDAETLNKMFA